MGLLHLSLTLLSTIKSLSSLLRSMGTQRHYRFHLYQKLIILLLFFCFRVFPYSEVRTCDESSDSSINSNIRLFCTSEQYIMQSYFQDHQGLLDSDFQDFIAHRHPSNPCESPPDNLNSIPRISLLQRDIIGEGSHRHLLTSFGFQAQSQPSNRLCKVVIIERLPSGVFVDPFELQSLQQRGGLTDVAVFGDTNLELPSFLSNRTVVEIHMEVSPDDQNELQISIKLPLHARYQPLEDNGYAKVEFGDPDLLLCCSNEQRLCDNNNCLVLSIGSSKSKTSAVIWNIPAGIRAHTKLVSVVTFATAILSALFILVTSVYSSKKIKLCKNLKQS